MQTVTSHDGTTIAYDSYGSGPALILVGGALSFRKFKKMEQISEALSGQLTVINYDRRGRGDSSPAGAVSVEREIEDIAALIQAAGGRASLWGWSSGGALAIRAAGAGIGVDKLTVYEAPFMVDPNGKLPSPDYSQRLDELVAAGDRNGAVKHFMRNAVGLPAPFVAVMRLMPMWKQLRSTAHTLPFDWAALGDHNMHGTPLDPAEFASVTVSSLVAYGSKSPHPLQAGSRALAEVLPSAELRELEGQTHNVSPKALAPLLTEFLTRNQTAAVAA
ncbi:MAG TPA: alpha/beta hydrolase [Thermoleophilaceae bacterium]|nr:alpha/beta hydrolase [Thermoleophilaceae bacterium]